MEQTLLGRGVEGEANYLHLRPGFVNAALELHFERSEKSGRTILSSSLQQPPLRVVRAFEMEDGAALAHIHNVSGGLLGGDCLRLSVTVGPEASAQLTTTGSTRVYRPRKDALAATQVNHIDVAENALLEYVPDSIIPFAGSRFSQRTTVQLARGAGLFWWEIIAPGREARGELFEYERLELEIELMFGRRHIVAERVHLDPKARMIRSLARLGPYNYWATFYICRVGLEAGLWITAEKKLRETATPLMKPGQTLWGISTLTADGLVVRCLARQGRDVVAGLHTIWSAAKSFLYQRNAIPPRKVN